MPAHGVLPEGDAFRCACGAIYMTAFMALIAARISF